jgi:hypothetical protein
MKWMKKLLALHAHFYQPHTQDLWLGDYIEDSWGKKTRSLTKACYGANSASRIIGADGRIEQIVNNYRYLSFSFDPQLLETLKLSAPNVYHRILQGDKLSMADQEGFGNALAQPYSHSILPLLSAKEQKLQIDWGISSFQQHFGRDPLGMWLPEMGVSFPTIDFLIEAGIQFILLNPWQGHAVSEIGSGQFVGLFDQGVPSDRPFRVDRPGGSLNVFFYNPTLTDGIYFGHWLRDANSLFQKIEGLLPNPSENNLLSAATHGDIYGNREAFGDMCLSALTQKIKTSKNWEFTNFAHYLAKNPPKELVKLSRGGDEKGTSWSCPHGVLRWEKDCGCKTHGNLYDLSWKEPLSRLLKDIWAIVQECFEACVGPFEENAGALVDYLNIRTDGPDPERFLAKHFAEIQDKAEKTRILSHFEAIYTGQEMFSSGGWFVDSLSAPGAVHILMSTQRTLELLARYTAEDLYYHFEKELKRIPGQSPFKNAWEIYLKATNQAVRGPSLPAAIFLLDELLPVKQKSPEIGPYRRKDFSKKKKEVSSQIIEFVGSVKVLDRTSLGEFHFEYHLIEDLIEGISLILQDKNDPESAPFPVDLKSLPEVEKNEIATLYTGELESSMVSHGQKLFPELKKAIAYSGMLGVAPPPAITNLVQIGITRTIQNLKPRKDGTLTNEYLEEMDALLSFAQENHLRLPLKEIKSCFTEWIAEVLQDKEAFLNREVVLYLDKLLRIARKAGIEPDITVAQTMVFEIIEERLDGILLQLRKGDELESLSKLRSLIRLGKIFAINLDFIKDQAMEFENGTVL